MQGTRVSMRWVWIGILAAIALFMGLWLHKQLTPHQPDIEEMQATVLTQPRLLKPFVLIQGNGKLFNNQSLEGHWTFLFFGYTHCPDICPTTMAILNQVYNKLEQQKQALPQVVLVSVDPNRDTPRKLQEYVSYFNPAFIGATGSRKEIDNITQQLGIAYQIVIPKGKTLKTLGDNYLVDHSGAIILIDPQAQMHAIFTDSSDPERIAQEFVAIKELAQS
ncbi:MAG: SCO family protein [Gammaproteobacteria bacterium]|nr:SCO family protein [Gammaproteobacteria bacterium]